MAYGFNDDKSKATMPDYNVVLKRAQLQSAGQQVESMHIGAVSAFIDDDIYDKVIGVESVYDLPPNVYLLGTFHIMEPIPDAPYGPIPASLTADVINLSSSTRTVGGSQNIIMFYVLQDKNDAGD